ncbi:MAG: hypothetical protein COT74_05410 [Bdellovibrionales bacterium CG10_big_fil_rev_8_21_14_0_10_45_34]|nr:MAG: hypothetical protein COT74_05410 [Bdellovibrionales bacterium CG10_big_fil_rev_8_21_14_0_10_45_34]
MFSVFTFTRAPLALISCLVVSQFSYAIVDMRNANFSESFNVLEIPGSGYDLRLKASYQSRSLHNGLIGFGWCTDFETKLEHLAEGAKKITECGAGLEIIFKPANFSKKNADKLKAAILAAEKKSGNKNLKQLTKDLDDNDELRQTLAQKHKLKFQTPASTIYLAEGSVADRLELRGKTYIRTYSDGTFQKFDLEGNVIGVSDRLGNHLKYEYKGSKLVSVVDNNGRKLTFSYSAANNKVEKITGPEKTAAYFSYKGFDLTEIVAADKETYKFEYDSLHNMIKMTFKDGSKKQIKYDSNRDWVTGFVDANGCAESYDYEFSKKDPENHYWANVEKKCQGKVTNKSRYEFKYEKRPDGLGFYLAHLKMKINEENTEIDYHPNFGKPQKIVRNGKPTLFKYDKLGLVEEKIEGKDSIRFEYDPKHRKIARVIEGKDWTTFKYDRFGNPIHAKNSKGQEVSLAFGRSGKIERLVDQAKREVHIKYNKITGRPEYLERPGVGRINLSYDSDGNVVQRTPAKEQESAALQITAALSSMIQVFAPSGMNLGL